MTAAVVLAHVVHGDVTVTGWGLLLAFALAWVAS